MNSLYRYLTKITGFLGLWIMIFPGLGLDCDSASAKNRQQMSIPDKPSDGGGKIIMLKIATESPDKQFRFPERARAQQSPSAKKQLLQHSEASIRSDLYLPKNSCCILNLYGSQLPNINHLMLLFP